VIQLGKLSSAWRTSAPADSRQKHVSVLLLISSASCWTYTSRKNPEKVNKINALSFTAATTYF
jgi:hypothetical protein